MRISVTRKARLFNNRPSGGFFHFPSSMIHSQFVKFACGYAPVRPSPNGIPAPVRCVSRQTKGNKAEERLDFCIYRTAKQRFCQGFEDKRGKMLFQDDGQAYHSAGGNAVLCAV